MKKMLYTANFLMFVALGMQACDKNPEPPKNTVKSFFNKLKNKFNTVIHNQSKKQLVIIIPNEPQSSTQQKVGKSNVLNTDTSEPQFAMFANMPEEIIKDQIMTKLDDKSLLRFAHTSKNLRNLAQERINEIKSMTFLKKEQRKQFKKKIVKNGTELDLREMNLKTIYPGVFNSPEFKNVDTLNLSYNNLTKLDKGTFKGLSNLRNLSIQSNGLKELHRYIFQDLKALKYLELSFNKLTTLPNDTFDDLDDLIKLRLVHNKLTYFDKNILRNLKHIAHLVLSYNPLTRENVNELIKFKNQQKNESQSFQSIPGLPHEIDSWSDETHRKVVAIKAKLNELGIYDDSGEFTCEFNN